MTLIRGETQKLDEVVGAGGGGDRRGSWNGSIARKRFRSTRTRVVV
jgi:hypothetical protein